MKLSITILSTILINTIICTLQSTEDNNIKTFQPKLTTSNINLIKNINPEFLLQVSKKIVDYLPKEFQQPIEQNLNKNNLLKLKQPTRQFVKSYKRYIHIYEKRSEVPVDYMTAAKRAATETLANYRSRKLISGLVKKLTSD